MFKATFAFALVSVALAACSGSPSAQEDNLANDSSELRTSTRWCNTDHTADSEEGNFGGFGGYACNDASAKTKCASLGGHWCKGYVDVKYLMCACGN
jgi:hypothetical protein